MLRSYSRKTACQDGPEVGKSAIRFLVASIVAMLALLILLPNPVQAADIPSQPARWT